MANLSISKAWLETKAIIDRDGSLILTVALAMIVLPQVIVGLLDPPSDLTRDSSTSASVVGLVALVISLIGQLALIRLALGPPVSVGEAIAHGGRRFLSALGALLLFGLGMALVLVPLVIVLIAIGMVDVSAVNAVDPAQLGGLTLLIVVLVLALAARLMLLMPVASAEPVGPVAVLKRAWALSKGHYWRLLAFLVLILLVAVLVLATAQMIAGVLARITAGAVEPMSLSALVVSLIVGLAQGAFTILSSVMLARIYVQLAGHDAEVGIPKSGS